MGVPRSWSSKTNTRNRRYGLYPHIGICRSSADSNRDNAVATSTYQSLKRGALIYIPSNWEVRTKQRANADLGKRFEEQLARRSPRRKVVRCDTASSLISTATSGLSTPCSRTRRAAESIVF